jgi:hypothetical protein
MKKRWLVLPLFLAAFIWLWLGFFPAPPDARGGRGPAHEVNWSNTTPPVNETHLFEGEISRRGQPVGFHSRPGGKDPENARVVNITEGPNRAGVYGAEVEVHQPDGPWLRKRSTIYPDAMSREDVVRAVLNAYEHRTTGASQKFSGPSGKGFTIEGYLLPDGRINTAFPIYRKDQ